MCFGRRPEQEEIDCSADPVNVQFALQISSERDGPQRYAAGAMHRFYAVFG